MFSRWPAEDFRGHGRISLRRHGLQTDASLKLKLNHSTSFLFALFALLVVVEEAEIQAGREAGGSVKAGGHGDTGR